MCVYISTSFIFCLFGERLKSCFGSIIQLTGSCDLRCDSILFEEVSRNMFDTLTLLRGDPRNGWILEVTDFRAFIPYEDAPMFFARQDLWVCSGLFVQLNHRQAIKVICLTLKHSGNHSFDAFSPSNKVCKCAIHKRWEFDQHVA